jgi:pimeloyl-ACP methyl ester carboxylesterase
MARTTMFQRSTTSVRFRNDDMDFTFLSMLGYGVYGGATVGELFGAATSIRDGDPHGWIEAFLTAGTRLAQAADNADGPTGDAAALRAFTLLRSAAYLINPRRDDRLVPTVQAARRCFARAMSARTPRPQPVRVPFEGRELPGWFYPAHSDGPAPTLVVIPGGDLYAEDAWFFAAAGLAPRGYAVLAVDMPGFGLLPADGLHVHDQIDAPARALLDHAAQRPDVDADRLMLFGISGGGYLTLRLAARDPRVRAAVATTPIADLGRVLSSSVPPLILRQGDRGVVRLLLNVVGRRNPVARNNMERFAWQAGTSSLLSAMQTFDAEPVDPAAIDCPVLCLAGDGDPPELIRQTREVHAALRHPGKALRIFTAADGAEAHCQVTNFPLLHAVVCDWLDDVLSVPPTRTVPATWQPSAS